MRDHEKVALRMFWSWAARRPDVPLDVLAATVARNLRPHDARFPARLAELVAREVAARAAAAKARKASVRRAYHAQVLAYHAGRPMPEGFTALLATLPQS